MYKQVHALNTNSSHHATMNGLQEFTKLLKQRINPDIQYIPHCDTLHLLYIQQRKVMSPQ